MVVVREGDQSKRVTKQRAFVMALLAKSLKGDSRAANTLLSMIWRLTETGDDAPELADPLLDDELAIVKAYEDRVRRDTHDDAPNTLQDEEETSK